jgi:hypothetical protein
MVVRRTGRWCLGLAAWLSAISLVGGCNFLSTVTYWSGGSMVKPVYTGLAGKRVAVVCVADGGSYGSGGESAMLARMVGSMLAEHIADVEVVPASEIADWEDRNDWNEIDYREIGRGVKADRVVALDLSGLRLHQGSSLYKGQAAVTITVLDMHDGGREAFSKTLSDITYPVNGFYSATDTSEAAFRRVFLSVVARQVARHFFEYDALDEFGPDPAGVH